MDKRPLLTGFLSRFSIAYAVVIGALVSSEAYQKRGVSESLYKGLRGSSLLLGILVGALLLGRYADVSGRKSSLLWSTIIRTLGMIVTVISPNYPLALLFRFIAGFGIGGSMASTTSYILERSHREVRGRNVVFMESMRARGSTIASVAAIVTSKANLTRETTFAISTLFGILTLIAVYLSPETIVRLARRGDEEAKRLAEEMGFVISDKTSRVSDLLRSFFSYTILLRIARAIVGFTYYYRLYTVRSVLSSLGVSAMSAYKKIGVSLASQLIGYAYAYLLIDKIGRRPLLVGSFVLGAVSLPLYFVSPTIAGAAFVAFNVGVRGTIYTYTPELYPTELRATALGSAVAMARAGAILGPMIGYMALSHGLGLRVAILAIVHAAGSIFVYPLPETKGKTIS